MSVEKNVQEALRWLRTAEDDLDSATILRKNEKFPHACFHAQQAGEKALKAVWYFADADAWGHSIKKLIDNLRTRCWALVLRSHDQIQIASQKYWTSSS